MSWASKSGNDWLTKLDISEGISASALYTIGSGPAGKGNSDWITKSEVATWVQMGSSWASNSDWATKGGVSANALYLPYSYTIYYLSPHSNREGFDTKDNACAHSGVTMTVYSSSSTLAIGSSLYYLSGGVYYPATFSLYGGTGGCWIYNSSVGAIQMTSASSNVILDIQSCPTAGRMLITFSNTSVGDVCTAAHQELLWYDQSYGFTTGAAIYTNGTLTTPYSNPSGWTYASILYVDGGNGYVYNFSGNTVGSYTGVFC
jgi:hypothetical protein